MSSGEDDFIVRGLYDTTQVCVICANSKILYEFKHDIFEEFDEQNFRIVLEFANVIDWLDEFMNEKLESLQQKLKSCMNNMPTTMYSCSVCYPLPRILLEGKDIPSSPCHFCCGNPYWWSREIKSVIESRIELVYLILNKIRERNRIEDKFTLLLCGKEMEELYGMLEYSVEQSTGRDKYSVREVKMTNYVIDIIKKQAQYFVGDMCEDCFRREELMLRPHLGGPTYLPSGETRWEEGERRFSYYLPNGGIILKAMEHPLSNQTYIPIPEETASVGDYVVAILDIELYRENNIYTRNRSGYKPPLAFGIPPILIRIFGYVEKESWEPEKETGRKKSLLDIESKGHLVLPKQWVGRMIAVSKVCNQARFILSPNITSRAAGPDVHLPKSPIQDLFSAFESNIVRALESKTKILGEKKNVGLSPVSIIALALGAWLLVHMSVNSGDQEKYQLYRSLPPP